MYIKKCYNTVVDKNRQRVVHCALERRWLVLCIHMEYIHAASKWHSNGLRVSFPLGHANQVLSYRKEL